MCLCALALRVAHHTRVTYSYTYSFLSFFLSFLLSFLNIPGSKAHLRSSARLLLKTFAHDLMRCITTTMRYETHTHTHTDNDMLLLLYYPTALLPLLLSFLGDPRSLTRTSARAILEDVSCLGSYIGIMQAHTRATMLLSVFYGDPKLKTCHPPSTIANRNAPTATSIKTLRHCS